MITKFSNYNLKALNTFGINAFTLHFATADSVPEITEILQQPEYKTLPKLILGGGSNILFTQNYNGLIIKPLILGIEKVSETSESTILRVGAGVDWDNLVEYTVNNNLGGIENLSLIHGNTGASPIQNIGAYGVEVKDCIDSVEGIYIENGSAFSIQASECNFGYRHSIFKESLKGKIVVTHVNFKLTKKHEFKLDYGNITEELKKYSEINLRTIREAIIAIRKRKLPSPEEAGNAGSFFKNPVVSSKFAAELKKEHPEMPVYCVNESESKIPAAFLIEKCGWKGYRKGDAGVHANQPLVLVNFGNASGADIINLSEEIIQSIHNRFQILLEREVNVV